MSETSATKPRISSSTERCFTTGGDRKVLRDVEGLSTQQAAEIVGVGEAAFKSRLHQARLRVRAAIGDEALIDAGR